MEGMVKRNLRFSRQVTPEALVRGRKVVRRTRILPSEEEKKLEAAPYKKVKAGERQLSRSKSRSKEEAAQGSTSLPAENNKDTTSTSQKEVGQKEIEEELEMKIELISEKTTERANSPEKGKKVTSLDIREEGS